jgi:hypothetical protein
MGPSHSSSVLLFYSCAQWPDFSSVIVDFAVSCFIMQAKTVKFALYMKSNSEERKKENKRAGEA